MNTRLASPGKPTGSQGGALCLGLLFALGMLLAVPVEKVTAGPGEPGAVSTTATLSILAGPVQYVTAGGRHKQPAKDGMDLAVGDRILTGEKATALITFLDGSTVTVQPESEVAIQKAEIGDRRSISVQIHFGTVWAHVVRAIDPRSSFVLVSNAATATVHDATMAAHDSLIGGRVNSDRSFDCWTRAGILTVKDEEGQRYATLMPGEKTTVQLGKFNARFGSRMDPDPVAQPFAVTQSALRITTSATVYPLVLIEDKVRAAGFLAPSGVTVNQVFGSYTGMTKEGEYVVEVPAGVVEPFLLLLEGAQDDSYKIKIAGLYNGEKVYQQELSGTIKKGERLSTEITHQLDSDLASYPKMARIVSGRTAPLRQFNEGLPAHIMLPSVGASK